MDLKLESFNIEQRGSSDLPAVICIHGFLGTARNLMRLTDGLAKENFHVVSYDQRGHGRSAWLGDYTIEQFATDLKFILDQLGLKKVHLVGHSMGGRVCMHAAHKWPHRVLSVTLLDVGPRISQEALDDIRAVVNPLPDFFQSQTQMLEFFKTYHPAIAMWLRGNLKQTKSMHESGEPEFHWMFDLNGLRAFLKLGITLDQRKLFSEIQCPTAVIRGARSKHIVPEEVEEMKTLLPGLYSDTVADAGHWLHADNPAGTLQAVVKYLKGLHEK